jgi:hypothetical protein
MNEDRVRVDTFGEPCLFWGPGQLEYLKLLEHTIDKFCNGNFIVEENGFKSLNSLCIDSPKVPNMQFKVGAIKSITTSFVQILNAFRNHR